MTQRTFSGALRFTKKLRRVPFDLHRPYLVDDPDFEVEKHLHRIAVPSPGGRRELAEVVGHLYARHPDRRKSLWEMWLIERLANGRCALFFKTHHAIMDGASGAGLAELLFDTEPNPSPRPVARTSPRVPECEPGALLLATRGLESMLCTPYRLLCYGVQLARQLRVMLPYLLEPEMPSVTGLPRVSFNAPLGRERAFASISVPLAAVKKIKDHFGVKVNDVLLALTGSAVRRYLEARGELPEAPLVPVRWRRCSSTTWSSAGRWASSSAPCRHVRARRRRPRRRRRRASASADAAGLRRRESRRSPRGATRCLRGEGGAGTIPG